MKVDFIGGDDVQRSLNHSDSRCVNLIPALNDKGDIAAFYNVPGLTLEVTNPASAVGSGIYTASNGRCFEVAGTTLYELTEAAGVISTTSRGTVTVGNPIYRMSDNGIEMILVNGTDGWLFTFATNALQKIKVATDTFTVTIADPAVFTQTGHGLVAGDAIRLTSTTDSIISDTTLAAMSPATISTSTASTTHIAVAPAGDFAYISSGSTANSIRMYTRDATSGELSELSFTPITGTSNYGIVLSSDGISAYTLQFSAGNITITALDVNTTTGEVTASGLATDSCGTYTVANTGHICISPSDDFVYVVNTSESRIYQFSRNAGTGELAALTPAYVACAGSPRDVAISGDGLFLYATSSSTDVITIFDRNNVSGLLTLNSTQATGTYPSGITLTTDHVYVTCVVSLSVYMYSRNTGTGLLTALSTATIATETGANKIAITSDGASVYVTNQVSQTVSMYSRDSSSGILTDKGTISSGGLAYGIAISPDDESVYVTNPVWSGSTVAQFSRNATSVEVGLPDGLAELTTYYVISAGLTADAFEVSETSGGTAVSTSGQQAGVHTYTTLGYGFPEGCKTVSYMNGRFVALEPDTQNFYVSEVLDGKWWDALNVQTVDSNPDYVIGETVSHNELIVFCQDSGEVFYDSGTTPTPFVRNTSGIFEVGCVAPYSICNLDNQVFWLGGNKNGTGIVYKLQGFTPMRISTHSIEYAIQEMTDISDARAFSYQMEGHHFYCLTFPTGDKTYVYDVNTGIWHERANFAAGSFSRWEATEHAYFAGKHLVLDYSEGNVYSLDNAVYTYGTEDRKWLRSFRVPTADMNRTRHNKLQLDCEAGVGLTGGDEPTVMLKWSDDGGHTWSNEVWRSMGVGSTGEYNKRVVWHRLGMTKGQPRIYELSGTAAVKTVLLNVHLD